MSMPVEAKRGLKVLAAIVIGVIIVRHFIPASKSDTAKPTAYKTYEFSGISVDLRVGQVGQRNDDPTNGHLFIQLTTGSQGLRWNYLPFGTDAEEAERLTMLFVDTIHSTTGKPGTSFSPAEFTPVTIAGHEAKSHRWEGEEGGTKLEVAVVTWHCDTNQRIMIAMVADRDADRVSRFIDRLEATCNCHASTVELQRPEIPELAELPADWIRERDGDSNVYASGDQGIVVVLHLGSDIGRLNLTGENRLGVKKVGKVLFSMVGVTITSEVELLTQPLCGTTTTILKANGEKDGVAVIASLITWTDPATSVQCRAAVIAESEAKLQEAMAVINAQVRVPPAASE